MSRGVALVRGEGLSPRGRGKLGRREFDHLDAGSIPAWAGETMLYSAETPPLRVYPRVGGGNARVLAVGEQ